jgi:phosphoribosylamine-glycine ligase
MNLKDTSKKFDKEFVMSRNILLMALQNFSRYEVCAAYILKEKINLMLGSQAARLPDETQ